MTYTADRGVRALEDTSTRRPAPTPPSPLCVLVVWSAVAAGIAVGAGLFLAGRSPAVCVLAVGLALVLALGQHVTWTVAVAGTPAIMAVVFLPGMLRGPDLGLPLKLTTLVLLLVLGVTAVAVTARQGWSSVRVPGRTDVVLAAALATVPVAWGASLLVSEYLLSPPNKVSWLMHNDSTWHLMVGRMMVLDGGYDPVTNGNPAPLSDALVGAFMAPGRSGVAPAELMEHDLLRAVQALILVVVGLGILAGLALAQAAPRGSVHRLVAALAGGVFTTSWFVSGLALQYGFWSAMFALLFLVSLWVLWSADGPRPTTVSFLMILASTALLATWAPLVIVGAGLTAGVIWRERRQHLRLRGRRLAAWLVAPAIAMSYTLAVTLSDFRNNPTALAMDGAHFTPRLATCVLVAVLAIGVFVVARPARDKFSGGLAIVVITSALGVAYMMWERASAPPAPYWGYYPAKFGWLTCVLIVLVMLQRLVQVAAGRRSRVAAVQTWVGLVLVAAAAMSHFAPQDPRPLSATYPAPRPAPDWRITSMFPVLSVLDDHGASDLDDAATAMLDYSSPNNKTLFSRYFADDPLRDSFANFWFLQQDALVTDPIRSFAYTLAPQDPVQVCQAVTVWGPGTRVVTSVPEWKQELREACPDASFKVIVEPPPA